MKIVSNFVSCSVVKTTLRKGEGGGGGKVFFLFSYIIVQHIKIIVWKFEVHWSKTNGDMEL